VLTQPVHCYPRFEPRAPWLGADLQTLRNALRGPAMVPAGGVNRIRLELPMPDGTGDRLVAHWFPSAEPRSKKPLIVLIHGLGGSTESPYIATSTAALQERGYAVLALNLRGAGESRPLCRDQYHAGRTSDLNDALMALPSAAKHDGVVVVGYSLGGNMALKFAAEYGGLRGVVSISAPIDLSAASHRFLHPRNRFYHAHLLRAMKRDAMAVSHLAAEERRSIARTRTILEFDERIVAPRNGYAGAADYYEDNHARRFLHAIELPALLIQARDDPWIPARAYTDFNWAKNERLQILLSPGGGHLGFHARGERTPWHDRCVATFLDTV
jgi:predicted alpha/beta-fold hydrolase